MANLHYLVVETSNQMSEDPMAGVYRETDTQYVDRATLIRDLIDGQYDEPVRIVAFDPQTADVSAEIAKAVSDLAWTESKKLSEGVIDFCEDWGVVVPEITYA